MYTEQKECSRCKKQLPATSEYFPKDSRRLDGFSSHCRTCNKFAVMKTKAKNKGLTFEEYLMQIEQNKLKQRENKEKKVQFEQEVKEARIRLEQQLKRYDSPAEGHIIYNGVIY